MWDQARQYAVMFYSLLPYAEGRGGTGWDAGTLLRIRRLAVRVRPSALRKCWSAGCGIHQALDQDPRWQPIWQPRR